MKTLNHTQSAAQFVADINDNFSNIGVNTTPSNSGTQILPLGDFVVLSSGTYTGWVAQKDEVCPSSHGATYTFKLPDDIVARVFHSIDNGSGGYSSEISDGGTFTFDEADNTQRILFNRNGGTALTAEDVMSLCSSGEIQVTYEDFDVNINNASKDALFTWAKGTTVTSGRHGSFPQPFYKKAVICHISDTHGDITRVANALKFAKFHGCDDVVHTGDAVLYKSEGISHVFKMAEQIGQHVTYCLGNHESYPNSPQSSYIDLMEAYGANNAYVGNGDNGAVGNGYFYHDITDKKIRIISLNLYENASYSGGSGQYSNNCKISTTQFQWLVDALKSIPSGWGVIIAMHQVEGRTNPSVPAEWSKFRDTLYQFWSGGQSASYNPIMHIVDAFIRRAVIDMDYDIMSSETEVVSHITLSDTFENVASDAQFVCYLVGHSHGDGIGVYHNSGIQTKQIVCMVTSGNALQTSGGGDLAFSGGDMLRYGKGVAQDAFNLIGIDLDAKTLRVVRVGSDLSYNLNKRDYIEISFAQPTSE